MKPLSDRQEQKLRETMNTFVANLIARQAGKLENQSYSGVSRFFSPPKRDAA